nr:uncharacterized protein LOC113735485 [Coffea arabica]
MDNDIFVSWTLTVHITPQRQKLYKYYLVTPTGHKTLAATALHKDPKHYTYKYSETFIEQHFALVEDVGLFELKNAISIAKWLERVLMFVSPHPPDAPLPHFIPDIYGPLPCCFTIRFTKTQTLRLPHDLIPMIQHCRQPFLTIKGKNAHWLIALRNFQFAEGWNQFAADHKLTTGDIILFKYLANMEFNVAIFKKKLPATNISLDNTINPKTPPRSILANAF